MNVLDPHIPDFVLLTTGRSGSTYLDSLLDSHPEIRCAGELLGSAPIAPGNPQRELEVAFANVRRARELGGKPIFGFKLPWVVVAQGSTLAQDLFERGARCVALHRKNRLDKYVSVRLAQINDEWSSTVHYAEQSIEIDVEQLRNALASFEHADEVLMRMSQGWPRIVTSYEAIVADPDIPWIQDFLGVEIRSLSTQTLRARTKTLRETIRNYDEVAAALAGTPYERFLDVAP